MVSISVPLEAGCKERDAHCVRALTRACGSRTGGGIHSARHSQCQAFTVRHSQCQAFTVPGIHSAAFTVPGIHSAALTLPGIHSARHSQCGTHSARHSQCQAFTVWHSQCQAFTEPGGGIHSARGASMHPGCHGDGAGGSDLHG